MQKSNFISEYNLWDQLQHEQAKKILGDIKSKKINTIRVSFPDQHGILRGKTITAKAFENVLFNGCRITTTLLLKDTSHRTVFPVWQKGAGLNMAEMTGAGDFVMVPDPMTFHVLPWVGNTAWILCDCYLDNGLQVPFSTRHILKNSLQKLTDLGYSFVAGIELELSIYKIDDPRLNHIDCGQPSSPLSVSPLAHGFQYLTESRFDQLEPVLELIRDGLDSLAVPLTSIESEFGPSQVELVLDTMTGCIAADTVILIRSAVKQICQRHGYHATFMCRPNLANAFSSGWHLHQSLIDSKTGNNVFVSGTADELLSRTGRGYLAGLLKHAREACLFSTPTINGYKRYRPYSLAPNQIVWGKDNRGAMLRVVGSSGDGSTHLENRVGESAANPYLYFTSQIVSGIDGIEQGMVPPEAVDTPYNGGMPKLPRNILEAINELRGSKLFRGKLGDAFIDYYLTIKEFELNRFLSEEVTDWEHKEYFEIF